MRLFNPDADRYIWITRWKDFQHYRPDPKRGPAWIKDYTAQLADERYLQLTDRQRALLRDLRDVFATMRGRLPYDTRLITRQRNAQTRRDDVEALNHAGFIQVLSREGLEDALEDFYSGSSLVRAGARSQEGEEEEEEKEKGEVVSLGKTEEPPAFATLDPALELEVTRLVATVTNKDNGSERVLRSYAHRLPLGTIIKVRESATGKPAAYAVSALKDECRERGIGAETRRKTI